MCSDESENELPPLSCAGANSCCGVDDDDLPSLGDAESTNHVEEDSSEFVCDDDESNDIVDVIRDGLEQQQQEQQEHFNNSDAAAAATAAALVRRQRQNVFEPHYDDYDDDEDDYDDDRDIDIDASGIPLEISVFRDLGKMMGGERGGRHIEISGDNPNGLSNRQSLTRERSLKNILLGSSSTLDPNDSNNNFSFSSRGRSRTGGSSSKHRSRSSRRKRTKSLSSRKKKDGNNNGDDYDDSCTVNTKGSSKTTKSMKSSLSRLKGLTKCLSLRSLFIHDNDDHFDSSDNNNNKSKKEKNDSKKNHHKEASSDQTLKEVEDFLAKMNSSTAGKEALEKYLKDKGPMRAVSRAA